MASQHVTVPDLGNEFDIGTEETNKIHIKHDATLVRDATTGQIGVNPASLSVTGAQNGAQLVTGVVELGGALLHDTTITQAGFDLVISENANNFVSVEPNVFQTKHHDAASSVATTILQTASSTRITATDIPQQVTTQAVAHLTAAELIWEAVTAPAKNTRVTATQSHVSINPGDGLIEAVGYGAGTREAGDPNTGVGVKTASGYLAGFATDGYLIEVPIASLGGKKHRVVQALVAGNNVIAHNLALTNTAVLVDVRNNTTGATIAHRVVAEAANSTTIWVAAAVTGARITIMG